MEPYHSLSNDMDDTSSQRNSLLNTPDAFLLSNPLSNPFISSLMDIKPSAILTDEEKKELKRRRNRERMAEARRRKREMQQMAQRIENSPTPPTLAIAIANTEVPAPYQPMALLDLADSAMFQLEAHSGSSTSSLEQPTKTPQKRVLDEEKLAERRRKNRERMALHRKRLREQKAQQMCAEAAAAAAIPAPAAAPSTTTTTSPPSETTTPASEIAVVPTASEVHENYLTPALSLASASDAQLYLDSASDCDT